MRDEYRWIIAFYLIVFLVGTIFSSTFAMARTYSSRSAVSTKYQPAPSFQTLYGSQASTYWPILGDKETCDAREDFMLQVAPFGCQPAVVRSDLLAEQDVPVFCQINAIDINPLIKVEQIKNIQFRGQYPPEVAGSGFHPARAALRTQNTLLGSPLANNVGYVVVVLKRQPEEAKLPDFVNVSLQAYIEYEAGNAYGIGRSDFVLEPVTQENWASEKLKNSFWNGRYFVRLEGADENYAEVSIYEGDKKIITTRVQKGKTSNDFYVPGMYCRAGLKVAYDDYIAAQKKARIEVSSGNSFDSFDVYEGSNFYDGRCTVRKIDINSKDGETGRVIGSCAGKQFVLELKTKSNESSINSIFINGKQYPVDKLGTKYWIDLGNYTDASIKGRYYFDGENLVREGEFFIMNSTLSGDLKEAQKTFFVNLYSLVRGFVESDTTKGVKPQSSKYFEDAIGSYERVADDYSGESEGLYGKEALRKAIDLAREFEEETTMTRLINRYVGLYPGEDDVEAYKNELESIRQFDSSLTGEAMEFDNTVKVLRLVSLKVPAKKSGADLTVQGKSMRLALESTKDLNDGNRTVGTIKLDKIDVDKVEVGVYCYQKGNVTLRKESHLLKITDTPKKVCNNSVEIRLDSVDVERAAKIRLIPKADGSRTETNLTVFVGIEKRAIQLTPDKVRDKIENLNKTIQKWEKIAKTLGKVVSGLKGACFATAALLTFKNFMTGLSGEAIARQEVMNGDNGWTQRCKSLVPNPYPTIDACYIAKSSEIDADVAKTTAALNKVNAKIKQIQDGETKSIDVFGKSVDTEAVRKKLAQSIKDEYSGMTINLGDKTWTNSTGGESKVVAINELLSDENVNNGLISTEAMRSLMLNAELQKNGGLNGGQLNNTNAKLSDVAERVNQNMIVNQEFQKNKAMQSNGYPAAFEANSQNAQTRYASVRPLTEQLRTETGFTNLNITHIAVVLVNPGISVGGNEQDKLYGGGLYNLGLKGDPQTGTYSIAGVTKQGAPEAQIGPERFAKNYNLGNIKSLDSASYQNQIQSSDRYVRYYETEPYKGMPAIVPFDTKEGWYAATQRTLPAFGGIGAFDASGRVTSFWICNVGKNGRIQFDSGFGDDLCQQVNLNTGQPLNAFPGLDSNKASTLIQRGQRAIMEAAKQYGNKFVTIGGERFEVGKPSTGAPGTQCQDFMSPKDCHLMFNVCDPVVCPPSRCNLGGTYNVANVAQTGIIGSIFLCLPNIREGILIPVCLTGIHAGIEGLISIMKNYRDCLTESLENGRMVGICDQIYSIYLCEFFWNQVAPFVNILIPKLIEMAYGQGVRGGAEYLSVMSAWQNMQNSIDYFTQSYAANSFKAFRARGIQEVGTEVCKSFISVKSPTDFDTLLEPDSPPQFHAWFDEKTFTTVTVPATSQYKVFYHIFAGKDQGVHYNVYLRDPPASGYYASTPTISVASGFIPKGEYASQSRDFTAPEGYKELCVRINNDEECGFKQVSSSFAVNYLRDSYIKGEASRVTITSQKECVSGSNNPATLLTPNVQAGAEEFVSPELYNRGIIRICSSDNPGSKTDPSRFVDTGYCDNPKIRCWVDKRSIEQAITQGNVGTLNETLEVLDARTKALLNARNLTLEDSAAENALMLLKSKVAQLSSRDEALSLINESNALFEKLNWNANKAQLLIIRGDAQKYVARDFRRIDDELNRVTRVVDESEGITEIETNKEESTQQETAEAEETFFNYSLATTKNVNGGYDVQLGGTDLGFYLNDTLSGKKIFVKEWGDEKNKLAGDADATISIYSFVLTGTVPENAKEEVNHLKMLNGKTYSDLRNGKIKSEVVKTGEKEEEKEESQETLKESEYTLEGDKDLDLIKDGKSTKISLKRTADSDQNLYLIKQSILGFFSREYGVVDATSKIITLDNELNGKYVDYVNKKIVEDSVDVDNGYKLTGNELYFYGLNTKFYFKQEGANLILYYNDFFGDSEYGRVDKISRKVIIEEEGIDFWTEKYLDFLKEKCISSDGREFIECPSVDEGSGGSGGGTVNGGGGDTTGGGSEEGGENVPEQIPFEKRFVFEEVGSFLQIKYKTDDNNPPKDTRLYIKLTGVESGFIKYVNGKLIAQLSNRIEALKSGSVGSADITIIEGGDIPIVIDGVEVFRTSCLDGKKIVIEDDKMRIDFAEDLGGGCPVFD